MKSHRVRGLPLGGESTFPSGLMEESSAETSLSEGRGEKGLLIYGFSMKYKSEI